MAAKIRAASVDLFAKGNLDAISDYFTKDYVVHLTDQDLGGGHKAIRKALELYRSAFPDLRIDIEILVESDERISWMRTLSGTQLGAFKGFPASGHKVTWREMVVSQFRDGLISEEWLSTDLAERLLLSRKIKPAS